MSAINLNADVDSIIVATFQLLRY